MGKKHIKLYFPRWFWQENLGDSIMLSSVFKAVKTVFDPCFFEVITDKVLVDTFYNDPFVDNLRHAYWWEKHLPENYFYKKKHIDLFFKKKDKQIFVIWPDWQEKMFSCLSKNNNMEECIHSPYKNILSYNFALQIGDEIVKFDDLRPRIYFTDAEIREAKKRVAENSIAINIATIRYTQTRKDGEALRYKRNSWEKFVCKVKKLFPELTIYEIGQNRFEGIGDKFIPKCNIRQLAAILNEMRLVVLSDGGIHAVCNAIDKKVLLFQAYEWNPPDLFKMHNAIFNESYHIECRKQCHLFTDILKISSAKENCERECYALDPLKLAQDCIDHLK